MFTSNDPIEIDDEENESKKASKSSDLEDNADAENSPAKMGHFVVDNLDPKRLLIATPKGDINIDVNSIHNLLGLPNGGIQISKLTKPEEYLETYLLWRGRYGRRSISPTDI
ncbi:hypothetical protein R6Q57_005647 [Mikania cordata]